MKFGSMFLLVVGVVWFGGMRVFANTDEARTMAMEAAAGHVKQGFQIREDYWSGRAQSGKTLLVKHQLFKGNEYVFWLGAGAPLKKDGIDVKVYDKEGNPIFAEAKAEGQKAWVRVKPAKTGSYVVVLLVDGEVEGGRVPWVMMYGFK